jgi:hypothetical protein
MDTDPQKKWFLAILVVSTRAQVDGSSAQLVDLQYKLVQAIDAEAAYHHALELGAREVQEYEGDGGELCHWDFSGLFDLLEIEANELRDGVEIYYEMKRADPSQLAFPKEQLRAFWSEEKSMRARCQLMGWEPPA